MNTAVVENKTEAEAIRYLEDQAYVAMLGYKEPVRSGDIGGALENDKYTSKLIRHVLASSPRFTQIDRKWDLEMRYEDKQVPVERVLRELIKTCGRPMLTCQIANELSQVYERPAEYYESYLARVLSDTDKFFRTSDDRYGLSEWLLLVDSDDEEDVIFDNDLSEEQIAALEPQATKAGLGSEAVGTMVAKFVEGMGSAVDHRYLSFFRWRAVGESFDPVAFFEELYHNKNLVWLTAHSWVTKKMADGYDDLLASMADRIAEELMEEAPAETVQKAEVDEDLPPVLSLTISDADLEEVVSIIKETGESRISTILDRIFEISPRDREYAIASEGLNDAMRTDPRLTWVGTERWRMASTVPDYVSQVPEALAISKLSFETMDGDQIDVEIEDDGLEGGLDKEIHSALVQDVGDEDEVTKKDMAAKGKSVRCVLKAHHHKLGTFPLCQIPKSFFPFGAPLLELTLIDGDTRRNVWANRDTGLMYDMGDWYTDDMPESGAVFELAKTDKPDQFQFVYKDETDPLVFVPQPRVEELLDLSAEAGDKYSVYELMQRIIGHHTKGVPFVTLFTEVNLVRRTSRRMVASILSSYYAFYQRGKSALWLVDEKKVDQGFKKAKRKYIRK